MKRICLFALTMILLLGTLGAQAEVSASYVDLVPEAQEIDLWTQDMADAGEAGQVMSPEQDGGELIPKAASKKNLVNSVYTKILSSGKVQAKVFLNTAYAGLGRTKWYVYAIAGEGDPVVESFDDTGISTPTEYTMKATFNQGEAVLFGAYTDVTARDSWVDTGDVLELMNNASDMVVEMPAKSTDPKDNAETITFTGDKNIAYNKTLTFPNGKYQYIKLVLKKDAVIDVGKFEGSGVENAALATNEVLGKVYPVDDQMDKDTTQRIYADKSTVVKAGTYWLCVYFYWYDSVDAQKLKLDLSFTLRPSVDDVKVKWVCKEEKNLNASIFPNRLMHFTLTVEPKSSDYVFNTVALNSYVENGYDEKLSDDGKTLTFTAQNAAAGEMKVLKVALINKLTYATKTFTQAIGSAPDKPSAEYHSITTNSKSAVIEAKNMGQGAYNGYVRGWIKSGKKWVKKLDEPIYPNGGKNVHTFTKLKPNTTYQFKYAFYIKNGDSELISKPLTFTAKTGVEKAPVVASAKVTNKKKSKKVWVDGYWENRGSKLVWVKGHYSWLVSYNLVVTLKSAPPKGALGLKYGDQAVAGKGKSFTFKFKNVGSYPTEGVFNFYSDATYGGLSPASKKVKFK